MSKSLIADKHVDFIKEHRLTMSGTDMAKLLHVSKSVVSKFMRDNGLSVSPEIKRIFKVKAMTGKTTSTKSIDVFLKSNYLQMSVKRMATKINKSSTFVSIRLKQLDLIQPKDLIERFKKQSRIQPGSIPPNKGKKIADYMSPDAIQRIKQTQFHKGNIPHNTKSDFTISIRPDNRGIEYKFIRIKMGEWIPLHRYNWIQVNGPIPTKMKLVFKDENPMNCEIDNLELVSYAELMRRNSLHNRYPKDITSLIQLRGALNRQINKHLKKITNEK